MHIISGLFALFVLAVPFARAQFTAVDPVAACESTKKKRACTATPTLRRLFSETELSGEGDFELLVSEAQRNWLRPKGIERWQITERLSEKRSALVPIFGELGMVEAVSAKSKHYDYAAVHGATIFRIISRINYLIEQWNQGVRFDNLVFLSGERPLDADLEFEELAKSGACCGEPLPSSEVQMIQCLYKCMPMPDDMRALKVSFIDAQASETRAHTGDTVMAWLAENPKAGSILAVSSQPFIAYQDMIVRNHLPEGFEVETIGEKASDNVLNAIYLDNLARLLYELRKWEAAGRFAARE